MRPSEGESPDVAAPEDNDLFDEDEGMVRNCLGNGQLVVGAGKDFGWIGSLMDEVLLVF